MPDVYTYDTLIKPIENVRIMSRATAYADPVSWNMFILIFHKSLEVPEYQLTTPYMAALYASVPVFTIEGKRHTGVSAFLVWHT
jgi:hypothetical protein